MNFFDIGVNRYKSGDYINAAYAFLHSIKTEEETRSLAYYNLALAYRSGNKHDLAYIYFDWFLKITEKVMGYETLRKSAKSFNNHYEKELVLMSNTIASVMCGLNRII